MRWLRWRNWLWFYRSAAGGWYVSIFRYGFHVVPDASSWPVPYVKHLGQSWSDK